MKKVGLILLTLILMVGITAGYHYSQQMTDEEKKAEVLSLLSSEDLANILESEDLVPLLKSAELEVRSDGQYDKSYDLVDLAGFDLADLGGGTRGVIIVGFRGDQSVVAQVAMGYIYNQKYVVVPNQLFYVQVSTLFGITRMNILELTGLTTKMFLIPDPNTEDDWKREELGEIKFMNEGSSGFAIVERIDPIVGGNGFSQYKLGTYEDLSAGDKLYRTIQVNGRMEVSPAIVAGVHIDEEDRNLLNFEGGGDFLFPHYGGLLFAIRDGEFELVGFICIHEPVDLMDGWVYIYGLDINQIIEQIELLEEEAN